MTRFFSILGLVWLLSFPLLAQSLTKQADRQFDLLAYTKAVELYEQALAKPSITDEERRAARSKLAYSYGQLRDTPNAERVYRDLVGSGELPAEYSQTYLYYAQALASNGKYRESQEAYDKYGKLQDSDKRPTVFSKLYRDVSALTRNAGSYSVEFLDMNTRKAEFSPVLYKGGLVFVSANNEGNGVKRIFNWNTTPFLDLYYLPDVQTLSGTKAATLGGSKTKRRKKVRTQLIRPLGRDDFTASTANDSRTIGFYGGTNISLGYEEVPISESDRFSQTLNTKYHEGPATFSKDGTRVIFTRNNYSNGRYGKSSDGINKLKLYTATQTNGFWTEAEELPFNSNEFSTGHPALSKDDKLLYFSSDRPGGFGGTDIYVSAWANGGWGEPVNLGKEVNSKGNELFPFVDEKNNLYVASDGHPGLGALDMFYAQLSDDGKQAKSVRNLGEPLNSPQDDFGIVTDADRKTGYFSSNRKRGGDDDDVYRFTRQGSMYPCRELTVIVFDADSKEPLANTTLAVDNPANDKQKQLTTDAKGQVQLCLNADSEFKFSATREGYLANKVGFSNKDLADDEPSRLEIALSKPREEPKVPTTLRGRVSTQTGKKPIAGVKVVLINECDGSSQETKTETDGTYSFTVQAGCDYSIEAMKDNMGTAGSRVAKDGTGSPDMTMFKKGDVMKIDNIYYDMNKATVRPDAAVELDKVVALMTKYRTMKIEMRSHTDSRSSAMYNKTLSGSRAKSAVDYLKGKGISPKRMIAKGYGESALLNKCKDGVKCSEEQHQQNRRTEIKILTL